MCVSMLRERLVSARHQHARYTVYVPPERVVRHPNGAGRVVQLNVSFSSSLMNSIVPVGGGEQCSAWYHKGAGARCVFCLCVVSAEEEG